MTTSVTIAMPDLIFDETKTLYQGPQFALKQYGGDDFVTFMEAFFQNYSMLHRAVGTLDRNLSFEDEQAENYLLKPKSVCLGIERNGVIVLTQMVTKRDERQIDQDGIFGLDYKSFYESETANGHTLYYFGKGSVNLDLFSAEERRTILPDLQFMLYYLVFAIARKDNCKNIYCYINRFMARSMQRQNIAYNRITSYTSFRNIDYVGVSYTGPQLDSLANSFGFDAMIGQHFTINN